MRYFYIGLFSVVLAFIVGFYFNIKQFKQRIDGELNSIILYDKDDKPFFLSSEEGTKRQFIAIDKINRNVSMAVVAVEDSRFFQHLGFDIPRLTSAVFHWVSRGSPSFGASTITQQLCKITLFSAERTLSRKAKELFCAVYLELYYSKKEILEFYLNGVYFGNGNVGVSTASNNFFKKDASQLNLAEAALLASLIKRPEDYSPLVDVEVTRKRQVIALKRLLELGWITKEEYTQAVNQKIKFYDSRSRSSAAPYFVAAVLNYIKERYGPETFAVGNLRVYTSIDLNLQKKLEQTISSYNLGANDDAEIAAVTLDKNGYVQAMVGGRDFQKSQFNRSVQAFRQPGSAIKGLLYAFAFANGWSPMSTLVDEPVSFPNNEIDLDSNVNNYYEPNNFDLENLGEITLAYALQVSNNIIAVKLLEQLGVKNFASFLSGLNINVNSKSGLCIALGCAEVSLINLASAFNIFNNDGQYCKSQLVRKVEDLDGSLIEASEKDCTEIITPEVSYIMKQLLHNVVTRGTATNANIKAYAFGKTGTTSNNKDALFVGGAGDYVSAVWLGYDDNQPLLNESGGHSPAIIWKNYYNNIELPESPVLPSGAWEKIIFNRATGCTSDTQDPEAMALLMPVAELTSKGCEKNQ